MKFLIKNKKVKMETINYFIENGRYIGGTVNLPISIEADSLEELKQISAEMIEVVCKDIMRGEYQFKQVNSGAEWLDSLHRPCKKCGHKASESLLNSEQKVQECDASKVQSRQELLANNKIEGLREKFFNECVTKYDVRGGVPAYECIYMTKEQIFEWFKPYLIHK